MMWLYAPSRSRKVQKVTPSGRQRCQYSVRRCIRGKSLKFAQDCWVWGLGFDENKVDDLEGVKTELTDVEISPRVIYTMHINMRMKHWASTFTLSRR